MHWENVSPKERWHVASRQDRMALARTPISGCRHSQAGAWLEHLIRLINAAVRRVNDRESAALSSAGLHPIPPVGSLSDGRTRCGFSHRDFWLCLVLVRGVSARPESQAAQLQRTCRKLERHASELLGIDTPLPVLCMAWTRVTSLAP